MKTRKASIKETGEELSPREWQRFDAAVAEVKAQRERVAKAGDQTDKKATLQGGQTVV